jgi:hypothetical protein
MTCPCSTVRTWWKRLESVHGCRPNAAAAGAAAGGADAAGAPGHPRRSRGAAPETPQQLNACIPGALSTLVLSRTADCGSSGQNIKGVSAAGPAGRAAGSAAGGEGKPGAARGAGAHAAAACHPPPGRPDPGARPRGGWHTSPGRADSIGTSSLFDMSCCVIHHSKGGTVPHVAVLMSCREAKATALTA